MNRIILISAVCMQFGWISGASNFNNGLGAYAYQDSNGNRYGGTYGLNDDQANQANQGPPGFSGFNPVPFGQDLDDFFPVYFRNFENLLQEAFNSNREHQRQALEAGRKAYDITSNQAGFIPNIDLSRFSPFGAAPGFGSGFGMNMNTRRNDAFASAVAAPGYTHQVAAISPGNPNNPNVDITNRFTETAPADGNGFMGVSSSSFASSSSINGQEESHHKSETIVNNNGKITHYKVEDK